MKEVSRLGSSPLTRSAETARQTPPNIPHLLCTSHTHCQQQPPWMPAVEERGACWTSRVWNRALPHACRPLHPAEGGVEKVRELFTNRLKKKIRSVSTQPQLHPFPSTLNASSTFRPTEFNQLVSSHRPGFPVRTSQLCNTPVNSLYTTLETALGQMAPPTRGYLLRMPPESGGIPAQIYLGRCHLP